MYSNTHRWILPLAITLLVVLYAGAQTGNGKRVRNAWRYNIGTSLNNYTLNDKHGVNPKQRLNLTVGVRREQRVTRDSKSFLLFGAEYLLHGLNYNSYYFPPDSVPIYDRKYPYLYTLTLQELHLPFEFKYLLRRMDNSPYSPYFAVGYHFRYLMPAFVKVSKPGTESIYDTPNMQFRTSLINPKINASLCLALGWQLHRLGGSHRSFFIEFNFQYGFSDYYFNSAYSASSMYINCIQSTLNIGARI